MKKYALLLLISGLFALPGCGTCCKKKHAHKTEKEVEMVEEQEEMVEDTMMKKEPRNIEKF